MTDAKTICHDLDLLGDWLDAKGYTEEAGLCLRVLGLIHEQAEENEKLREERQKLKNELEKWVYYWRDKDVKALSAENERLRAALVKEKQYGEREHREKMSHYQEVYGAEKVIVELRSENMALRAENEFIMSANNELSCAFRERDEALAQVEKLRAALKPFADEASVGPMPGESDDPRRCSMKFLRAAAAALKED